MEHLIHAKSKKSALQCFNRAFVCVCHGSKIPVHTLASELTIAENNAAELANVLLEVVRIALLHSDSAPAMAFLEQHSGGGLDSKLSNLVQQILATQLPFWCEASVLRRPSLPQYIGIRWRVDMKAASEQFSRMSVPSVIVNLKVQRQPIAADNTPSVQHIEFELSKEALNTMLDGLGRIRKQLGSSISSN